MSTAQSFECKNCKGVLEYASGDNSLTCPYCGTVNEIPEPERPEVYEELDYETALANFESATNTIQVQNVKCPGCQAEITLPPDLTTANCDFCGTQVVAEGPGQKAMEPQYMLPFGITREESRSAYKQWISSRRFAPSKLKHRSQMTEPLKGIYLPFWTYDSNTQTDYTGERGDNYTTTETYQDSEGNTKTRTVTKIRWYPARGQVQRFFDDVLVAASRSVSNEVLSKFSSWDLTRMVDYSQQYLAGFTAESYTIDVKDGLDAAKEIMKDQILTDVKHDIGGDHQRVHTMNTRYRDVTFKYILLPVWATMYKFKDKYYPVVVNGQTGEVQGKRPISWIKIAILVLAVAAVGAAAYFGYQYFAG